MSRWEREESDLNAVGVQNRQLGLDRSPIPVRPVRAELGRICYKIFLQWFVALIIVINLNDK